jgi:hypothetical protein
MFGAAQRGFRGCEDPAVGNRLMEVLLLVRENVHL